MKSLFSIIILLIAANYLFAQQVTTVAGQLNAAGSADGLVGTASFNNPHGLALDEDGNIYVADRYNHTIRKITQEGEVSTLAGQAGVKGARDGRGVNALFNEPWGLAVTKTGDVIVSDTKNNKIRKISPDGTVVTLAGNGDFGSDDGQGLNASFGNPTGIECDSEGNIYIADHRTHVIRVIDLDGNVSTLAGKPNESGDVDGTRENARFWRPYGLTLDHDGNILVADEWNHKIRKITLDGVVTTLAGTGELGNNNGLASEATFNYPWDVTLDSEGNIYIGDGYNYVIRILTTDGRIKNFAGNLEESGAEDGFAYEARFSGITSLAWSNLDNRIYVADAYNDLIRRVDEFEENVTIINTGADEICHADTVLLCSSLLLNNRWIRNGQPIEGAVTNKLKVTQSGTYHVINYSCFGNELQSNFIEVIVRPSLGLDFIADKNKVRPLDQIAFTANRDDLANYYWDFGAPAFSGNLNQFQVNQRYAEEGTYNVTLIGIDDFGCLEEVNKRAYIKVSEFVNQVFVPSAFTPNNDGVNDVFRIRGFQPLEFNMMVFDHWGEQIYTSQNSSEGWDGSFLNKPVPQGNYAYVITYFNGIESETLSGNIALLR